MVLHARQAAFYSPLKIASSTTNQGASSSGRGQSSMAGKLQFKSFLNHLIQVMNLMNLYNECLYLKTGGTSNGEVTKKRSPFVENAHKFVCPS